MPDSDTGRARRTLRRRRARALLPPVCRARHCAADALVHSWHSRETARASACRVAGVAYGSTGCGSTLLFAAVLLLLKQSTIPPPNHPPTPLLPRSGATCTVLQPFRHHRWRSLVHLKKGVTRTGAGYPTLKEAVLLTQYYDSDTIPLAAQRKPRRHKRALNLPDATAIPRAEARASCTQCQLHTSATSAAGGRDESAGTPQQQRAQATRACRYPRRASRAPALLTACRSAAATAARDSA
jgi:hypothetical protein